MKIEVCGGRIDKRGRHHRFPTVERDVPEDFFDKLMEEIRKNAVDLKGDLTITLDPDVWKSLKKAARRITKAVKEGRP